MDITGKVKGVSLVTKKSKLGNDYTVLQVVFQNGYKFESFLKDEQLFIINSMK